MKNSKTTKSNCSGEEILDLLIKLYEHQEQVKIKYEIKNKEAHYEKVKLEKVL